MKRVNLNNRVKMQAIKNFKNEDKLIDYYVINADGTRIYAFSKRFTYNSYDLCKSGIIINDLLSIRSRDTGITQLVRSANRMMGYLADEYQLKMAE